jgi:GGDEF domain-containing protein
MLDELQMLKQLGDALPFGVCIVDLDRQIRYWNHAAERITGHWRQDVMGRSCCDRLLVCCGGGQDEDGCSPRPCRSPNPEVHNARPAKLSRFFLRHKEGHRLPVLIRSLPLRDEDGLIVGHAELFHEELANQQDFGWLADARLHPALGIPSVAATEDQLRQRLRENDVSLGVFIVAIRDLCRLVRKYGEPMGLAAQRTLVHTLTHLLTVPHYLGCWTGDRLLVMVFDCSEPVFARIQQRLAMLSAMDLTWWGDRIGVEVDISGRLLGPSPGAAEEVDGILEQLSVGFSPTATSSGEMR